jgi:hypothetical protein
MNFFTALNNGMAFSDIARFIESSVSDAECIPGFGMTRSLFSGPL